MCHCARLSTSLTHFDVPLNVCTWSFILKFHCGRKINKLILLYQLNLMKKNSLTVLNLIIYLITLILFWKIYHIFPVLGLFLISPWYDQFDIVIVFILYLRLLFCTRNYIVLFITYIFDILSKYPRYVSFPSIEK